MSIQSYIYIYIVQFLALWHSAKRGHPSKVEPPDLEMKVPDIYLYVYIRI